MNLFLVRHLPTPWNEKGMLQGSKDISISNITPEVSQKIKNNLEELNQFQFDKILVSELVRTRETANHYGYTSVEVEPLINELDFGEYEGKPKQLMLDEIGDSWYVSATKVVLGEPLASFESRIKLFLEKYEECSNLLVFAHGAVIRAILELSNNSSIDAMNKLHIENNSLTVINWDASFHN